MTNYSELPVSPELLQAVKKMGFTTMTEIQQKAIPVMLAGREVIAKAPTGTGKTCAFGIPIIEQIDLENPVLQALVLCPTRELCTQIVDELRELAQFKKGLKIVAVYGGQPIGKQFSALKNNPQIVVATPGRLIDHFKRGSLKLNKVQIAVLDEADEMLDMGFFKDVRFILDKLPKSRKISMFSATISRPVMDIGWLYQRDAEELVVLPVEESKPQITQYSMETQGSQKLEDMLELIRLRDSKKAMIFCNTKYGTEALRNQMRARGLNAECLNGDMNQKERNSIMARFKAGEINYLVATDVAARGIDVDDVDTVFNYEMPNENEYYTHRIGRTGRAKRQGVSYIFYAANEKTRLRDMLKYAGADVIPLQFDASRNLIELPVQKPSGLEMTIIR
ncbi:DEAD/DEAH box helicase [Clostridiaceae bacterium NSJ-31]|uniref:DEAD/DEAH box helicase n=1 Tax=Ligaoa zhengdingensis TaxID=2763658 RepID=A0A926DXV1_9FIRM|nr:DEAD/DEAH box helicase [Ligaoa zhengdingensis]MBC8545832.1 DEAD/DEAH box helicase [Ligaoa zhengdingensis]